MIFQRMFWFLILVIFLFVVLVYTTMWLWTGLPAFWRWLLMKMGKIFFHSCIHNETCRCHEAAEIRRNVLRRRMRVTEIKFAALKVANRKRRKSQKTTQQSLVRCLKAKRSNRTLKHKNGKSTRSTREAELHSESRRPRSQIRHQQCQDPDDVSTPESPDALGLSQKALCKANLKQTRKDLRDAFREISKLRTKIPAALSAVNIDEATAVGLLEKICLAVEGLMAKMGEGASGERISYKDAANHVLELIREIPGVLNKLEEHMFVEEKRKSEIGNAKERVLQLESVFRELNIQARLGAAQLSPAPLESTYGAVEYISDITKLIANLNRHCQESYLVLEGIALPPEIGVSEYIQQCTMRVKHLNEKVDQNFKFRNAAPGDQEEMLTDLQHENVRLKTEIEAMTPEVEQTRHEMRILKLKAMDAAIRHASRAKLTIGECERRRSRYNFLALVTRNLLEFMNNIPSQYPETKLPHWIEQKVSPEVIEAGTSSIRLEKVQEARLGAIELLLYIQNENWPGSHPNWIPSGKNDQDDDHGRNLQVRMRQVSIALIEAEIEMSGSGLEDLDTDSASANGTTASRMKDRRKKTALDKTWRSRTSRPDHKRYSSSDTAFPLSRERRPHSGQPSDFSFTNPHEFWSTSFLDFINHQQDRSRFTAAENEDEPSDSNENEVGRRWRNVPNAARYYDRITTIDNYLTANKIIYSGLKLPTRKEIDKIRPRKEILSAEDITSFQIEYMQHIITELGMIWEEHKAVVGEINQVEWESETRKLDLSSSQELKEVSEEELTEQENRAIWNIIQKALAEGNEILEENEISLEELEKSLQSRCEQNNRDNTIPEWDKENDALFRRIVQCYHRAVAYAIQTSDIEVLLSVERPSRAEIDEELAEEAGRQSSLDMNDLRNAHLLEAVYNWEQQTTDYEHGVTEEQLQSKQKEKKKRMGIGKGKEVESQEVKGQEDMNQEVNNEEVKMNQTLDPPSIDIEYFKLVVRCRERNGRLMDLEQELISKNISGWETTTEQFNESLLPLRTKKELASNLGSILDAIYVRECILAEYPRTSTNSKSSKPAKVPGLGDFSQNTPLTSLGQWTEDNEALLEIVLVHFNRILKHGSMTYDDDVAKALHFPTKTVVDEEIAEEFLALQPPRDINNLRRKYLWAAVKSWEQWADEYENEVNPKPLMEGGSRKGKEKRIDQTQSNASGSNGKGKEVDETQSDTSEEDEW